ncbi:MAG: histidinol-phosphate transaminase [Calditrichaeota bacterium]|nr:histidinol-phosphate transaminase [Calditrichota bacterium]
MPYTEISPLARPIISQIVPYEPGKPISEVQREYRLDNVIKLASNENPLGPSPKALEAIKNALPDLKFYPDGAGYYLRRKISERFNIPDNMIVLGNGSSELIELICEAFISPGDGAVIGIYEYFKYRITMQIMNGLIQWAAMPGLNYDPQALYFKGDDRTKLIFIANPNNPTGTMLTIDETDWLMERIPLNVITVFDEAYWEYRNIDLYPNTLQYVKDGRNVVILRTFSKIYGLAGLRIGYAITTPEIAKALNTVREVFNVNSLGQVAAIAALEDADYIAKGRQMNADGKRFFYKELNRLGLEYVPSKANFVLIKVNPRGRSAANPLLGREVFQQLLKRGVVVRPMDGYGLKEYIRVSIALPDENEIFFDELELVIG